ncbi:MAG: hypothetical protein PHC34_11350 [Candidatus Gastranaerophilales bacterium]|nr:hypothetical protein [Candidatus Gastranaerophilales bacterium]
MQKQNDTIDNLADQLFSKTINSLSSNIKTSFTDILPESSASNYYISQKGRGLDRRIKLPRELVEREDDLRR